MKLLKHLCLLLIFTSATSCNETSKELESDESDKEKIVLPQNILPIEYIDSVQIKNEAFTKSYDTISMVTRIGYESDLWFEEKGIGGFMSSTYFHSNNDLEDMSLLFDSYLAGHYFVEINSSGIKYVKNDSIKLPFSKYVVYDVYNKLNKKVGISINVLKEKKMINSAVVSTKSFEFQKNELIKKINKI